MGPSLIRGSGGYCNDDKSQDRFFKSTDIIPSILASFLFYLRSQFNNALKYVLNFKHVLKSYFCPWDLSRCLAVCMGLSVFLSEHLIQSVLKSMERFPVSLMRVRLGLK